MPVPTQNGRSRARIMNGDLLLVGGGVFRGAFEDAEDFFFTHDEEIVAIDLDLGAGILAEQNAVANFDVEREGFTLLVALAFTDGDDFAFLWLVLGGLGDDDSSTRGLRLFDTANH